MKTFKWVLVLGLIFGSGFLSRRYVEKRKESSVAVSVIKSDSIFDGVGYVGVESGRVRVEVFADGLVAPTRLEITPDGKYLLVAQITGEVWSFERGREGWGREKKLLLNLETSVPGFPPEESGLTGLVFSSKYNENGKLFLLYAFKNEAGDLKNRVSVVTLKERLGKLTASKPELVFEANVDGGPSHQITDGVGVEILGKAHVLFLIGEGFEADRSQDVEIEGGKVMLIAEDGSDPIGVRPYSENPRVQALGIRNAYVMEQNPYDESERIMIGDTGPDVFDRVIYSRLFNSGGADMLPVNFGWNGSIRSLSDAYPDLNTSGVVDMTIYRFAETRTITGLAFHSGGGVIEESTSETQSVLITLFGRTGSTTLGPGKAVWLGRLNNLSGQPKIEFEPLVIRNPESEGKLGNPVGLEVDERTGDFLFADILEGKVYIVRLK